MDILKRKKTHFSTNGAKNRREGNSFEMGTLLKQLGSNYTRERNVQQCAKCIWIIFPFLE